MYHPDLSKYKPAPNYILNPFMFEEVLRVGWLEMGYDYPQGHVDEFTRSKIARLLRSEKTNINKTRGYHQCDFCEFPHASSRDGVEIPLEKRAWGSSEVWVPSQQGIIYAAPKLIYHYIVEHHYLPPAPFLEAVNAFDLESDWDGQQICYALVEKYRAVAKGTVNNLYIGQKSDTVIGLYKPTQKDLTEWLIKLDGREYLHLTLVMPLGRLTVHRSAEQRLFVHFSNDENQHGYLRDETQSSAVKNEILFIGGEISTLPADKTVSDDLALKILHHLLEFNDLPKSLNWHGQMSAFV